jgi:NitT/TauT family transport system substrate-binding protein
LAVTFIEGGPEYDPEQTVANKTAQFGVAAADVILMRRAEGLPLKVIATLYRRSPRVYIALASSGIVRPQDFAGKTIAINDRSKPLLNTLMLKLGIQPDQYTVVEATSELDQLYSGQAQVKDAFLTNEVLSAREAGYNLNLILPDDYGLHFYNQAIFTTEELIANDPDLVRRFLRASLLGWRYAVEHPDEAGRLVTHYNPKADPALEIKKMQASLPLILTGEDDIGWMKAEVWAEMAQILRQQKALAGPVDPNQVYTLQFLQEIYDR